VRLLERFHPTSGRAAPTCCLSSPGGAVPRPQVLTFSVVSGEDAAARDASSSSSPMPTPSQGRGGPSDGRGTWLNAVARRRVVDLINWKGVR
jgi:hypothetical protein